MKVQISRDKGKKEFHNNLLKIVYEDAYIIVVERCKACYQSAVNVRRNVQHTIF